MPVIEVHIQDGQPVDVKTRLVNAMTDAFRMVLPAKPDSITVILHEMERENYMRGGGSRRRTVALREPISVVSAYMKSLHERDFLQMDEFVHPDCLFHLPGGEVFSRPADAFTWWNARVSKLHFHLIANEVSPGERGPSVLIRASMSGEWLDGVPFEGVRLANRYEFDGDKICRVDMWNDLAEHALARGGYGAVTPDAAPDTDSAGR